MPTLILVVEDEKNVRELLITIIDEEKDFKATGANDGLEALELLKALNFNLITLDMNMPKMNGNAFLKELGEVAPSTPVIVVSATPKKLTPHPQVKAVIEKPFDVDQLLKSIKKFCT